MVAHRMHAALILNGIHDFIIERDLAQRCLYLRLRPLEDGKRRSERELMEQFQRDLPVIFRGLLEHVADVFAQIPYVEPHEPERLIDFSHWLAAMERVDGIPPGTYQDVFSTAVNDCVVSSLLEHPLIAAILELRDVYPSGWSGTPSALLQVLNRTMARDNRDWPRSSISLSRRLAPLTEDLRRAGADVRFSRSHERQITITWLESDLPE
jgi:hypothetical protein